MSHLVTESTRVTNYKSCGDDTATDHARYVPHDTYKYESRILT